MRWTVNIVALDTDDDMLVRDRAWARDFWAALRPHADSSGAYINFLADDDEDRVRAAYGAKYGDWRPSRRNGTPTTSSTTTPTSGLLRLPMSERRGLLCGQVTDLR